MAQWQGHFHCSLYLFKIPFRIIAPFKSGSFFLKWVYGLKGGVFLDVEYAASIPEEAHIYRASSDMVRVVKMQYLSLTLERKSWQKLTLDA